MAAVGEAQESGIATCAVGDAVNALYQSGNGNYAEFDYSLTGVWHNEDNTIGYGYDKKGKH